MKKNVLKKSYTTKDIPRYACSITWILIILVATAMTLLYAKLIIALISFF
jgi:hypothetical protein